MTIMRTPLYDEHVALGGRMVDFAGWELPVTYGSIVDEHNAVRSAAGIFDVSHMGEIEITGPTAADFLRRLIPTRLDKLVPGKSMYSCLCNEQGGVIDDLFIYMRGIDSFYLVVNASTAEKDLRWLEKHGMTGVEIRDVSMETAKIDLQGPLSRDIALKVIDDDRLAELPRFGFIETRFGGGPMMVSQSGYTGEYGYELYLPSGGAVGLWRALMDAGKEAGLRPCGLGSRDSLRLESCYSLYGHELDESTTPKESGIGWIVSSGDAYIGRDVLMAQKERGAPRETVYFELNDKGIPREGCHVYHGGREIGTATSAGFSPTLKKGIGIARVTSGTVKTGDDVEIRVREKRLKARLVARPFYAYKSSRA